jgi:hypothetical protein
MASAEPWLCTTPFGLPVEPEVEKITAGWFGRGPGQRPRRRTAFEQRGERLMPVGVAGDQHAHTRQRRRIDLREQRQPRVLHDQPAGAEVPQGPLDLRRCVAGVERSGDGAGGEARQVGQNGRRPVGQHQRDPLAAEARL